MSPPVKISILTAAWHAEGTIARAAASVLAQTCPHWEWVIASDDGKDYRDILGGLAIRDPRIRFTSTGRVGAGPAAARNRALAAAEGEVMAVLDADDTLAAAKLETLLPHVLAHGAATSDSVLIEERTGRTYPSLSRKYPPGLLTPAEYFTANLHSYSMQLWDRRRVEAGWDETIPFAEDLVHGACLFNGLPAIYYHTAPLHAYHRHDSSLCNTQQAEQILQGYRELIARGERHALPVKSPAALEALLRYLRRFLALEQKFFAEPAGNPSIGFYHFIARNLEAFHHW